MNRINMTILISIFVSLTFVSLSLAQFEEIDRPNHGLNDVYGIAVNNADGLIYVLHFRENTIVTFDQEWEEVGDRLRLQDPNGGIFGIDFQAVGFQLPGY